MTIRWGVSPIGWANDDLPELGGDCTLEKILADAREIGFEGVELGNKFPRDAAILGEVMGRHDLALVGGWYSSNLLVRDAAAEIAAMAQHIDLLKALGSSIFIIAETSNATHCVRDSRLDVHPVLAGSEWVEFGARLSQIADYVNEQGMRLAYHHHLGTVVETADELERFLQTTRDNVGLVLDSGHAAYGGIDPVQVVMTRPERIAHVHCKDVRRSRYRDNRDGGHSFLDGVIDGMFTVPGDGDFDFAPLMKVLADIRYSGWIVVEAEQDPAVADPRAYGQIGLETLKQLAGEAGLAQ